MWLAQAVSAEVFHLLQEKNTGMVHSVFNQSFNLAFGERLVHIGALDNGLAPFGIGLGYADAQMLTKKVKNGQSVAWDKRNYQFVFLSGETLSLQHALAKNLSLSRIPYNRKSLQANFEAITGELMQEKWQTGIVQSEQAKLNILHYLRHTETASADSTVIKEFADLLALAQGGKLEPVTVFNYWIGRGPGLTPSGDDILTGLTAMLTVLEGSSTPFVKQLASYLQQYGKQRTTQVGLEYLIYATAHQYHSHLVEVCKSVLRTDRHQVSAAITEMKKMGHTSGTDTLIGMLLGVKIALSGGISAKQQ